MTKKQKKTLFLANYAKSFNKSASLENVMSWGSYYIYLKDDKDFAEEIERLELAMVHTAESKYYELLHSEDENIVFKVAKEVINSKLGKKHSNLITGENGLVSVAGDKTITFKFGNDVEIEEEDEE